MEPLSRRGECRKYCKSCRVNYDLHTTVTEDGDTQCTDHDQHDDLEHQIEIINSVRRWNMEIVCSSPLLLLEINSSWKWATIGSIPQCSGWSEKFNLKSVTDVRCEDGGIQVPNQFNTDWLWLQFMVVFWYLVRLLVAAWYWNKKTVVQRNCGWIWWWWIALARINRLQIWTLNIFTADHDMNLKMLSLSPGAAPTITDCLLETNQLMEKYSAAVISTCHCWMLDALNLNKKIFWAQIFLCQPNNLSNDGGQFQWTGKNVQRRRQHNIALTYTRHWKY